jgi:hypothetical protein
MTTALTPSTRILRVTYSRAGLQGPPGPPGPSGVPDGSADMDSLVWDAAAGQWVTASNPLEGLTRIAVVDELPDPQVAGTLYFVKP